MVVMAFLSLTFGAFAGKNAASASSGLAANLREAIYANIQTFSFSNIDKFSVPGLVTAMTTDITNVQNAFMMGDPRGGPGASEPDLQLYHVSGDQPAFKHDVPDRGCISSGSHRLHYGGDPEDLPPGIPEVRRPERQRAGKCNGHPCGKGVCPEDYENIKFSKASKMLYDLSVKAEGLLAFNNPAMMIAVYFCIISVSCSAPSLLWADR